MKSNNNITKHNFKVTQLDRSRKLNQEPKLIWFTGLSGSGKSTIANIVEQKLHEKGIKTFTLDGDNVRKGINKDLSFVPKDRTENISRIAEVASLLVEAGLVTLAAFVSPYKKDRESIRSIVKDYNFVEVFVNTSLEECERRDVKGLYKKARAGKIKNMTGISAPYESPLNPDIEIKTEKISVEIAAQRIVDYIEPKLLVKE